MPSMLTFLTSAFWHGFYTSYYSAFIMLALVSEATKDIFKARVFFRWIPEHMRVPVSNISTMIVLNYLGITFCALTLENVLAFWSATFYFVPAGVVGFLILSRTLGLVPIAKKFEKKLAAAKEKL